MRVLRFRGKRERDEMRKLLIVVDMQNDFIDGSLGTKEAQEIVENVIRKIQNYESGNVFATRDTHPKSYLQSQEGRNLPVQHCIEGTRGWEIQGDIAKALDEKEARIFNKPTFGSVKLAKAMEEIAREEREANTGAEGIEIELVGLCTDICVASNAMLLKAFLPEVPISVDASCCAGVNPDRHRAALETLRSCQVYVAM